MNLKKYTGKSITGTFQKIRTILSLVKSITVINKDTVSVNLDKNIVLTNEKNLVTINKGSNVRISKQIHDNPRIDVKDFYENPDSLQQMLDAAVEKSLEDWKKELEAIRDLIGEENYNKLQAFNMKKSLD